MSYRNDSPAHYKSWTPGPSHSSSYGHSSWSASSASSPAPTPTTPHLHTVSLPHPNSAPRYSSSGSYPSPSGSSTSGILSLNPLLCYTGVAPICFNVTRDVQYIQLRPGCSPSLLQASALNPTCTRLLLNIPQLPSWPIEVTNSRGVTVYDVLVKIRDVLNRGASPMETTVSGFASEYFRARTRTDPREFAQGVKRIDFLGPNVYFAGLSRARDGSDRWDVYFSPSA
ncbi:hypothetical protein PAXINDRAFT_137749 [Paxillus involutus ATCC 200175]|uniref:DUF6699 domain-containing protein n=1 Tax=Paxillus involutus ATCC 200175 TaxID=664439 RepID=A0A0C9ST20_PAXIN|nr:hypothetical protein PAXINDRAFT_137749 [Paxillus involutus ATCC 200175]